MSSDLQTSGPRSPEQQRAEARGVLVRHALTRPANIAVAVGSLVVAIVALSIVNLPFLAPFIAVLLYALMASKTFFDGGVADRVLNQRRQGTLSSGSSHSGSSGSSAGAVAITPAAPLDISSLPESLARYVRQARQTRDQVIATVSGTDAPLEGITGEIDRIVTDVEKTALKASTVEQYIKTQNLYMLQQNLRNAKAADPQSMQTQTLEQQLKSLYRMQRNVEGAGDTLQQLTSQMSMIGTQVVELALIGSADEQDTLLHQAQALRGQVQDMQMALR